MVEPMPMSPGVKLLPVLVSLASRSSAFGISTGYRCVTQSTSCA